MSEDFDKDNLKLAGLHRGRVIDNKDPRQFGRVQVWVPDSMPTLDESSLPWALPANSSTSGLNNESESSELYYSGSCYVPPNGSLVWVFFEDSNPSLPFYLSAVNLEDTKVLAECQTGGSPQKKWVIYKSHAGRCIVISDDTFDERIELTGKKRQISSPPSGDTASVYQIEGNQTTILLGEKDGSEQLLIKTHLGDYINLDITNRKLNIYIKSDVEIYTEGKFDLLAKGDINIKSTTGNVNITGEVDVNLKATENVNANGDGQVNLRSYGPVNIDGANVAEMTGAALGAASADSANPKGERK